MYAIAALVASTLLFAGASSSKPAVFYVNMQGASGMYDIGRYVNGEPKPTGPVASAPAGKCHLWAPSVTRNAKGKWFMFVAEHDCSKWAGVVLYTSKNGISWARHGYVLSAPADGHLLSPYVVYDRGKFRAWFTYLYGSEPTTRHLYYAESVNATSWTVSGPKSPVEPGRRMGVDFVFRWKGGWWLLYSNFSADNTVVSGGVMSFDAPSAATYTDHGEVVSAPSEGPGFAKLSPSYACRRPNGDLVGLFTVFQPIEAGLPNEATLLYDALDGDVAGDWEQRVDGPFPALALVNGEPKTSVENPTPVTASAALQLCAPWLR